MHHGKDDEEEGLKQNMQNKKNVYKYKTWYVEHFHRKYQNKKQKDFTILISSFISTNFISVHI